MANQIFFAVLQNAMHKFCPPQSSEAKSVPKDTAAHIEVAVRHANPLFGSTERKIDGWACVVWLMVSWETDQIFFAVLQDADFLPTSEAKSVPKNMAAPILVAVRHANPLFGSIGRMIDGWA